MDDELKRDKLLLRLFEHDLELLKLQSTKDDFLKRVCVMTELGISIGDSYDPKKYLDVETLRKNLVKYYSKMSEEGKLYVALTYGIPE